MHLAPIATVFDIGQHALQSAHVLREVFHLAQSQVHLLEPIRYLFERFAQTLLKRGVKFFVHGHAHFFEFFCVIGFNR